ncbi:MAG: BCCT family transporter [Kiloniellales bacterium]|nr:BCCT family transporter [Kiloniellales bacterium]MDJ0970352.1 BCCT family transporter [Kiloniellales bacterium]MDJ0983605.1 BCCT family transporter [Kiloniellales bacterium]
MAKNAVLIVSVALSAIIGIWSVVAPDQVTGAAVALTSGALKYLDWMFMLACTMFVLLSVYLALGPYGDIKLGHDDDEPEFSTGSWIAMLFAGGMGSGLLFWGVAEPMYHFYSPPGEEGLTTQAARTAFAITNLHWGFHAWAIYGVCALVIAYFVFRKDAPSMVSTPIEYSLRPLLGDRITRWVSMVADVVAVMAVVFGLAGSLGMGTIMVRSGLAEVFGTDPGSLTVAIGILIVMTIAFLLSACTGVDKGIKILSNINMVIAIVIMLVVLFAGPTTFILDAFVNSFGDYLSQFVYMSFRIFSYDDSLRGWTHGWTLTYLIWWIAWGPFVGIFIARISRGRTIREFVLGVVVAPTVFSMLWFSVFGGAAIYIEMFGGGGLAEIVFEDVSAALYAFFGYLPGTGLLNILAVILVFIFLVTSADSGTFVVSMMTTNGNLNPDVRTKLIWGILMSAITFGVLVSGSVSVAKAMAITGAVPFTFIVFVQLVGFFRALREDESAEVRDLRLAQRMARAQEAADTKTPAE